jgi:hypothetical protein
MSAFLRELVLVRRGFGDRIELTRRVIARATAGPLLVRGTVFGSALLAMLLAYPAELFRSGPGALVLVLAALPAMAPRGALVTVTVLAAVVGWIAATTLYAEPGQPIALWRLAALAGALYLLHTTAALAAVLPYDTVVAPDVLLGWLLRAVVVIVLTAGFAVAVLVGVLPLGRAGPYLVASILGLTVMAGLAWLLVRLRRRGGTAAPDHNS